MYWIMTFLVLLQLAVRRQPSFASGVPVLDTPLGYVVSSLLFFPYRNSLGNVQPILMVGWTLCFEMFFYLLFATALALRIGIARFLVPLMVALAFVGIFRNDSWPTFLVLASPLLLEFLAGVLIGRGLIKGLPFDQRLILVLGAIAVPFLFFVHPFFPLEQLGYMRVLQWGVPACLLVCAVIATERPRRITWPRWTLLVGDASYALYLCHFMVIGMLVKVLSRLHLWSPNVSSLSAEIATIAVFVTGSLVVALGLHLYVEKPITRELRNRFSKPQTHLAVAVPVQ